MEKPLVEQSGQVGLEMNASKTKLMITSIATNIELGATGLNIW